MVFTRTGIRPSNEVLDPQTRMCHNAMFQTSSDMRSRHFLTAIMSTE